MKHFDLIKSALSTLDREQLLDYASFCCLMISLTRDTNAEFIGVSDIDIEEEDGHRASNVTQLVCERISEVKKTLN